MNINKEQLEFLKKELNISREEIEKMSKEDWTKVREKCFFIEADELMDLEPDDDEESERCLLATSIADIKYSQLNS